MYSDGTVVAVATYVQRAFDPKDWVKQGTRFEDTRRFGLLLSNRAWVSTTPKEYYVQIAMFEDISTYCSELIELGKRRVEDKYLYGKNSFQYLKYKGLCQLIDEYSKRISQLASDTEKIEAYKRVKNNISQSEKELMGSYYDGKISELENIRLSSARRLLAHSATMIRSPTQWINEINWTTKRLKSEADNWVAVLGLIGLEKDWIQISD